ncbi:MAG: MFS transporter [Bryobacteraceae bacterium]|nr:MFS transporter [Bryobacteraceae bacterium]
MPPLIQQVRWRILTLLLLVTIINFVDRQSLSIVAPILRDELKLSNTDYGFIVSAFLFGMLAGEFPMGWLMDRKGARFGLSFAVLWWSLANALHAFARTKLQFAALRFWLGTGECGNYSGGIKVVSAWFPPRERALAIGVFNGGSMLGSIIAPPLLGWLTLAYGWHSAFLLPSALGALWVVLWWWQYAPPAKHRGLSKAEAEYIHAGRIAVREAPPTRELLGRRQTWAIMTCRLLVGPVVQFYIFWLPEYLFRQHGFNLKAIALFAWMPFLFGDIGSIAGGWVAGRLMARGWDATRTRRFTMGLGAAFCLLSVAVAFAGSAFAAIAFICAVLFGHTFLSANMFASISDMFPPEAAGRVTALTGIAGGASGMVFPLLTGALVDHVSYVPVFLLAAVMPALGCLALFLTVRRLEPVATS